LVQPVPVKASTIALQHAVHDCTPLAGEAVPLLGKYRLAIQSACG